MVWPTYPSYGLAHNVVLCYLLVGIHMIYTMNMLPDVYIFVSQEGRALPLIREVINDEIYGPDFLISTDFQKVPHIQTYHQHWETGDWCPILRATGPPCTL